MTLTPPPPQQQQPEEKRATKNNGTSRVTSSRQHPRRRRFVSFPILQHVLPVLLLAVSLAVFPYQQQQHSSIVVQASLVGDEQYQRTESSSDSNHGAFWVFHSDGVSIVDPVTCQVDHSLTEDADGRTLPQTWQKGAYMQLNGKATTATTATTATATTPAYVVINSGESGEVLVLKTTGEADVQRIPVGPSPGNAYAVHQRNQFWSHSNDEGYFYVIDLESELESHTGHPIKAKMKTAHKSHLLWDVVAAPAGGIGIGGDGDDNAANNVDSSIVAIGYATNAGESFLTLLDMDLHKQVSVLDFSQFAVNNTCAGASTMAYSKNNRHLYVECVGPGGILEFDVSRPKSPLFIAQHVHIGGTLVETPDRIYVTATDKGTSKMHFLAPTKTGQPSTDPFRISVAGHPMAPSFYEAQFDYVACMPLTTNTNKNHVNPNNPTSAAAQLLDPNAAVDPVVCDYFNGCSQAETQADVDHGMCLYRNGKATGPLLTASLDDIPSLQKFAEPFARACDRCASDDGNAFTMNSAQQSTCTCTPNCGACASDDYPTRSTDESLQTTGVTCVDAKDAMLGIAHKAELIPGAGAIKHVAKKLPDPACGFAEPERPHKRGNNFYDASISTVPHNQLVIVDMRVQREKCKVLLPGEPQQLVYVPTSFHTKGSGSSGSDDGLSGGMIAMIVLFSLAALALVVIVFVYRGSGFASRKSCDVSIEKSLEMTNGNGTIADESKREENEEEGSFVISMDAPSPLTKAMQRLSSSDVVDLEPASGELA